MLEDGQLRAISAHVIQFFFTEHSRAYKVQRIALDAAYKGERSSCAAAGVFDNRVPGLEPAISEIRGSSPRMTN